MFIASGSSTVNLNIYDTSGPRVPKSEAAAAAGGGLDPMHVLEGHTRDGTPAQFARCRCAYARAVFTVDWAPKDMQLASCSDDGTTRLWTVQVNRPKEKKRRTDADAASSVVVNGEAGPRAPPRIVQARLTQFFSRPPD